MLTREGLEPFVEHRLKAIFGGDWSAEIARAQYAPPSSRPDLQALLKTIIHHWNDTFRDCFDFATRSRARSYVSLVRDARNDHAHHAGDIDDAAALRYLDAMHELLCLASAAPNFVQAVKQLYDAQRGGPDHPRPATVSPAEAKVPLAPTIRRSGAGTLKQRLLAAIVERPGQDDDQLHVRLGTTQRQNINIAARQLERDGLIKRELGPRGKIVNVPR